MLTSYLLGDPCSKPPPSQLQPTTYFEYIGKAESFCCCATAINFPSLLLAKGLLVLSHSRLYFLAEFPKAKHLTTPPNFKTPVSQISYTQFT